MMDFNNTQIILFKMNQQTFLIFKILLAFFVLSCNSLQAYNRGTASYRNQTWMSVLDYGLPIREISILGTHVSLGFLWCISNGGFQQTQSNSLQIQLQSGIRALDIRVRHKNNKFQLYDRACDLGKNFDDVLIGVKSFLTTYSSQTVLLHLFQEGSSSGTTRSFQDTYKSYRDAYPGLIWLPTTQDPQLGEVRGKIVLLQEFNGLEIHGLLWATFSVLGNKRMGTNWDLYDKWLDVKNFMVGTNAAKKSKIAFWTGNGGSYPYFVVSGKSDPWGNRLLTGYTTPGWRSCCSDFPRVACFFSICTILFQGVNILGLNWITSQNFAYTGIIFTDFYGDDLLKRTLSTNTALYPKCSILQVNQGCTLCQLGSGNCLKCNTNMNYVYDSVNKICLAQIGYYLDALYIPQLCYAAIPGCLECSSATLCTRCDDINHYLLVNATCQAAPGYYLDLTVTPVACPQVGCSECSDSISCTLCTSEINYIMDLMTNYTCVCDDPANFIQAISVEVCICKVTYFLSPNSTCEAMPKCPDLSGGCLTCSGIICLNCDLANNFVFDTLTHTYCVCDMKYFFTGTDCALCNTVDAACDQCASADMCLSCVDNFTLTTGICQCSFQYYMVDNDTCQMCELGCLVCSGIGVCTVCDTSMYFTLISGLCDCIVGRFQANGTCQLCGAMAGCVDCNNAGCIQCEPLFGFHLNGTICQCDYGFFINQMNVCQQCMMDGCLGCTNQSYCIQCSITQFYLTAGGFCDDICGDGIKIYVDCDDNNTIDGDGCSSSCKVETDYTCVGGTRTSRDICSYSGPFYMQVIKTIKDQKKNKVYIDITIKPNIMSLKNIDFSSAINPSFSYDTKTVLFDPNTGLISLEFTYNTSLNSLTSSDMQVQFNPPTAQPEYYYMRAASFNLPQVSSNNLALKYYDQNIYSLLQIMRTLTNVAAFMYVGVFLICFVFVSKLIAIELLLVPQIAFAGLIMIQKIQALLQPLSQFKIVNGYNPLFNTTMPLPPRLTILSYSGDFLSNFNICVVIIILPIFVALILFLIGKARNIKTLTKYGYKALKQWMFSVLLVFQFQFTVALGIDILYGDNMMGKAIGGVLLVGLICLLVLFYKKPLNFGEFKSYFIEEPKYLCHYIVIVVLRIFLALDLIVMSSNTMCGFIALGLVGLYTLFLIIQRPYLKNIRPIMNMSVVLIILAIQTVYKMNFYSSQAEFITSYLPLFIIILLLLLLLANIVFMILQVKQLFKKKQIQNFRKKDDDQMDEQLRKQLDRQLQVIHQIQLALNANNINKITQKQRIAEDSQIERVNGLSQLKSIKNQMNQKAANFALQGSSMHDSQRLMYEQI